MTLFTGYSIITSQWRPSCFTPMSPVYYFGDRIVAGGMHSNFSQNPHKTLMSDSRIWWVCSWSILRWMHANHRPPIPTPTNLPIKSQLSFNCSVQSKKGAWRACHVILTSGQVFRAAEWMPGDLWGPVLANEESWCQGLARSAIKQPTALSNILMCVLFSLVYVKLRHYLWLGQYRRRWRRNAISSPRKRLPDRTNYLTFCATIVGTTSNKV